MSIEPVASLFADDMPTVRRALAYVAEERLTDLCNVLGLKLSEAENLRDRCAELLQDLLKQIEPPNDSDDPFSWNGGLEALRRELSGTEPLIHSRYCPGGPAVFVNTKAHIAQCPGGCDIWFDTMMDEPTFPPHTVTITTTVTITGPADAE